MNKKFLLMFTATAFTLSAFMVFAEDKKPLEPMGEGPRMEQMGKHMLPSSEEMEDKLADKLGLDKKQREQAKKIREDGHKKVKPLMKEMKELREKMDKLRKQNMEEFEKILTPEQKNKFSEMKEKMKEKMKNKPHKVRKGRGHRGEHKIFEHTGIK